MPMNRRTFTSAAVMSTASLLIARVSQAQDAVAETDPTAVGMGYKADHTQVDTAVWTKKEAADGANQKCASCTLYQAIDDESGNCPIFAGKKVHANGWCNG